MTRLKLPGLMILWLSCLALWMAAPDLVDAQRRQAPQSSSMSSDLSDASRLVQAAYILYIEARYDEAIVLVARALVIREKALGAEHPDTVTLLSNLALLHQAKGDYGRAETMYQRALAVFEKVSGPESPNVSALLNNIGKLCREKGEYARAEPLFHRALAINEKVLGAESPGAAAVLSNLAGLYNDIGDYGRAEPLYLRALAIREKVSGAESPETATVLNSLAGLYDSKGDYGRAEPLYQRALAIGEKILGAEHPDTATSLNDLALLYQGKGDYERAEPLYQRALAITKKRLGDESLDTTTSMHNLAKLYSDKGDYAKAEPLYKRALAIEEKILGAEHPKLATSLNNLALLYHRKGDYGRAEPLYRRALAVEKKRLGDWSPGTAMSLNNLAWLYNSKGDYAQAEPLLVRAAEIWERNLSQILLTGSEQQKQYYIDTLSGEADAVISLHTHETPMSEQTARLALTLIFQRKGRALDAMTEQAGALRRRANPQDRQLLDQLLATRTQLATLQLSEVNSLSPEQRLAEISRLENAAEKLEATISSRSEEFRAQIRPITLAGVQQAIPPDAALIEFFVCQPFNAKATQSERWSKQHYVAYSLRREGAPKFVNLGATKEIDDAVAAWRRALRDKERADERSLARTLDGLVMRPVRDLLGGARRLLISPDGALNLIPFAALVDERDEYLVRNYAISYLTSGRDLLRLQVARASRQPPLVVANPDFGEPADSQSAAKGGQGAKPLAGAPSSDALASILAGFNAKPLPATAEEAQALKELMPESVILTGRHATETALKHATAPRLLHIATHGFFLDDLSSAPPSTRFLLQQKNSAVLKPTAGAGNPLLRSGLALAGFNLRRGGEDDGVLTALEATGLNLWDTQMVILSACDTGVGTVRKGQGMYGLRRSLVLAGAETQVMSLWPVSDAGTRDLMIGYYKALQSGQGRSDAMRQAQLQMLKSEKRQHPYYWAGFIVSGEWANLEGKR